MLGDEHQAVHVTLLEADLPGVGTTMGRGLGRRSQPGSCRLDGMKQPPRPQTGLPLWSHGVACRREGNGDNCLFPFGARHAAL